MEQWFAKKYIKRKIDNKMGSYGETDLRNKTIKINKKLIKKNPSKVRPVNKGAKKYPDLLDTIYHEELHIKHPKMTEKDVRKKTTKAVRTLTKKQKARLYGKYKKS